MQIVLASTSQYRATALEQLRISFDTAAPEVDEQPLTGERPAALALRLASAKALAVAERFPEAVVIGGDQVGECDGVVLSKPGTAAENVRQLLGCAGRSALFHSALAVVNPRERTCTSVVVPTRLEYRAFSRTEVEAYVAADAAYDCAGGFKVEAFGISLFRSVKADDPTALVGLPLIALTGMLRRCGVLMPALEPSA